MTKPFEPQIFPPWNGKVSPLIDPPRRELPNPWIIWIGTAVLVAAIFGAGIGLARTIDVIGTCAMERWTR